jgi:hypothetical protein
MFLRRQRLQFTATPDALNTAGAIAEATDKLRDIATRLGDDVD